MDPGVGRTPAPINLFIYRHSAPLFSRQLQRPCRVCQRQLKPSMVLARHATDMLTTPGSSIAASTTFMPVLLLHGDPFRCPDQTQ